jgi:hypothetical protein
MWPLDAGGGVVHSIISGRFEDSLGLPLQLLAKSNTQSEISQRWLGLYGLNVSKVFMITLPVGNG